MKITIGYLFYDLLNLYGESGNILALEHALKSQGIEVEIKNISIEDKLDLINIDIIYIGSGTEYNQTLAINYLNRYKNAIKSAIENNKFFLITGNSIEIFGKHIQNGNEKINTLNIFDYYTDLSQKRIVRESLASCDYVNEKILGFENHIGNLVNIQNPLFTLISKENTIKTNRTEGILYNNFYGTYLLGPILARNPEFLEYFTKKLILTKYPNFEFKDFNLDIEKTAHERYLNSKLSIKN